MKKFMLLYRGPATPAEQMKPEESQAIMAKWGEWMDKIGTAMLDMGQPMKKTGEAVVDDGSSGTAPEINGYSIVQAEDIEATKQLVKDHPFLSDKTGKFSVDIYEIQPVPGM